MNILVVDDSSVIRNFITQLLKDAGHMVITGEDGRVGLEKYKAFSDLDLIISDYNMPKMNGIEFIIEVRKLDQDIPILICTTEVEEEYKIKGSKAGANGWLVKPIKEDQLLDIVKQIEEK